ncbi:MAG: hypothetical protein NC347_04495 [Clostridium sp.]|nr:hypothetical protein [Clostridium sp.]
MNKKPQFIPFLVLFMLCAVAGGVYFYKTQKNTQTAAQRYRDNLVKESQQTVAENTGEEEAEEKSSTVFCVEYDFDVEVLGYSVLSVGEFENQEQYGAEYFYEKEQPSAVRESQVVNYEAIEQESPELKEMWNNLDKYSIEETKEIYSRNQSIIEKYTSTEEIPQKYVFVECRIKNRRNENTDVFLNELDLVATSADFKEWTNRTDTNIYFNQPEHTEGDDRMHSFFIVNMDAGEEMVCTLGFQVDDLGEKAEYYIGTVDNEMVEMGGNLAIGKNMFSLESLIKGERHE